MDYKKQTEQLLNNYNETKASTEIMPKILRKNKIEIYAIEKALNKLNEKDRELIQRICINGENPRDIADEKGKTWQTIYQQKSKAVEKFTTMIYGTKLVEGNES